MSRESTEKRDLTQQSDGDEIVIVDTENTDAESRASAEETGQVDVTPNRSLSEDTFSFLISAPIKSFPAVVALIVLALQATLFTLVAVNVIDLHLTGNVLQYPPNVDIAVRIAEFFALMVSVLTQLDIRNALLLLRDGYEESYFAAFDGASRTKWYLSIVLRSSEGILGLFVTFLLIMQSETVLDLLLNFCGMEFVSFFDELMFIMAKERLLGITMLKAVNQVLETRYVVPDEKQRTGPSYVMIVLVGCILALWGSVYVREVRGDFLCERIFVQFDDAFVPALSAFSGLYLNRGRRSGGRAIYESESPEDNSIIGYCQHDAAWTFSIAPNSTNADDFVEFDPCNWIAKSSESASFDVESTSMSTWFVKVRNSRIFPMTNFQIQCYDCRNNELFCGPYGVCNVATNECDCGNSNKDDERFGLRCEFPQPCTILAIDKLNSGFVGLREFSREYSKLDGVEIYNRPVWTSPILPNNTDQTQTPNFDILLFTGTRWILTSACLLNLFNYAENSKNDKEAIMETLKSFADSFHAFYSPHGVAFFSEEVYIDSAKDIYARPLDLVWFHSKSTEDSISSTHYNVTRSISVPDVSREQVEPGLLCAICNDVSNPCMYGGNCNNGTCECTHRSTGILCQNPPSNSSVPSFASTANESPTYNPASATTIFPSFSPTANDKLSLMDGSCPENEKI